jgi:hypothetical protein
MTKSATKNNVVVTSTQAVKVGRKSYTLKDLTSHMVAVYDSMWLLQEEQLDKFRELGNCFIQLKAVSGITSNTKWSEYLTSLGIGNDTISKADRYSCVFIASHWTVVQSLQKKGQITALGVSSLEKKIREELDRNDPKAAEQGKPKASASKDQTEMTISVKTEKELALLVQKVCETKGFDIKKFGKELSALIVAKATS